MVEHVIPSLPLLFAIVLPATKERDAKNVLIDFKVRIVGLVRMVTMEIRAVSLKFPSFDSGNLACW